MSNLRQIMAGILLALVSLLVVAGSLSLSLAEGEIKIAGLIPSLTNTPENSPTPLPTVKPGDPTFTSSPEPTNTPTETPRPTRTPCPAPAGWEKITVQEGETLESIAASTGTTSEQIAQANCIPISSLFPGTNLFVPFLTPTPTKTPKPTNSPVPRVTIISCGRPSGWVAYTVQRGDNLFRLGLAFGVSVRQLQNANCLGSSTRINTGQRLWVPNVPTRIPSKTPSVTPSHTPTLPPSTATSTSTVSITPPSATLTQTPVTFTATSSPSTSTTTAPAQSATPTSTGTNSPPTTSTSTETMTPSQTPTLPVYP